MRFDRKTNRYLNYETMNPLFDFDKFLSKETPVKIRI